MIRRHIMWPPFGRPTVSTLLDKDSDEYKKVYNDNKHLIEVYAALTDEELRSLVNDTADPELIGIGNASKETLMKIAMIKLLEAIDVILSIK